MKNIVNIASNWINILVSILAVFITYPILTRAMGEEQYGIWLYISSVVGYFTLLQLGVPLANVKFIAKYHAENDHVRANEVLSSNIVFYSVISLFVVICGLGFAVFIDDAVVMSREYIRASKTAMVIAAVNIALSFVLELFQGILHALSKFVVLNVIKSFFVVLRVVLILMCIDGANGLIVVSSIMLFITVVQGLVFIVVSKSIFREMTIAIRHVKFSTFKDVAKYSVFAMLLQIAGLLSFQTDALVVGTFISVKSVLAFSVASSIVLYITQLTLGISQVLLPRTVKFDSEGDTEAIALMYREYSTLTNILVLPLSITLAVAGGDFIALWMGEQFRTVSGNILDVLTLSFVFFWVQRAVAFPIFMGTSKVRFVSILMLCTAILNLLLSIWWGTVYGIYGVAWGTTVPNIITAAGVIWYMCKSFPVKLGPYLVGCYATPVIASLLYLFFLQLSKKYITFDSYVNLSISVASCVLLYAGVVKLMWSRNRFLYGRRTEAI